VSGTTKQPTEDGGEEEVETVGFKLNFTFKENPYFTNTVSAQRVVCATYYRLSGADRP
jgi:hypothetical protein